MSKPITLDSLDPELEARLRAEASRRQVAVEVVAAEWLKRAMAASSPLPKVSDEDRKALLAMAGTWSEEEAQQFLKATETFRRIDPELWK